MSARAFADTNVFVYAFDNSEPRKRDLARRLIGAWEQPLVISTQVIGEFYVVVTRKLKAPISETHAAAAVDQLLRLPVVAIDAPLARAAVRTSRTAQLSYWDALIIETAAAAGCERLVSEDLAHGSTIGSVTVENPFV